MVTDALTKTYTVNGHGEPHLWQVCAAIIEGCENQTKPKSKLV